MIVVLDSGIWISAFQFGGTPLAALDSVFSDHTVAICDQIVAEVRATLVRKFSWKDEDVLAILTEYTSDGIHVEVTGAVQGCAAIPRMTWCLSAPFTMMLRSSSPATMIFSALKPIVAFRLSRPGSTSTGLRCRQHSVCLVVP